MSRPPSEEHHKLEAAKAAYARVMTNSTFWDQKTREEQAKQAFNKIMEIPDKSPKKTEVKVVKEEIKERK